MADCNSTTRNSSILWHDGENILPPSPPNFGHEMLKCFRLDKNYINLNSGSYGSPPKYVLRACAEKSEEIESNPDIFMRFNYVPQLQDARKQVASFIGADVDECVFVINATLGINTVLRNIEWKTDDIIILTSTTYGAVERTIKHECDRTPGLQYLILAINFPTTKEEIISNFQALLKSIPIQSGRRVVAVIDSIASNPGVILPWEQMVRICREEGATSVVDAAHSIGQETNIDLKASDPDFWVSNCHKWMYAKRGCAVLYVPQRNQHMIKSSIPTSWSYVSPTDLPGRAEPPNFVEQFNKTGTADYAPFLSVMAALDFRVWIGGESKINEYCHKLALNGGKRLAEILGTTVMDPNGEFTANMVNVRLPLDDVPGSLATNSMIMRALIYDWNCYAAHFYHNGSWWVRCSTQIYNEISDFEYLGKALVKICEEIRKDVRKDVEDRLRT